MTDLTISEKQLLPEGVKKLREMIETYFELNRKHPRSIAEDAILTNMGSVLNKATGVLAGHYAEFQAIKKFMAKGRSIHVGHADVTAGDTIDPFAKSIQFKSTISQSHTVVNNMMSVAANQLTGERGETPRPGDRRIIEMIIQNRTNPWPYGSDSTNTLNQFLSEACKVIKNILTTYKAHNPATKAKGVGLNPATINSLTDTSPLTGVLGLYKNSTHPRAGLPVFSHAGTNHKLETIVVKIRFPAGRPVQKNAGGGFLFLQSVIFHALRQYHSHAHQNTMVVHWMKVRDSSGAVQTQNPAL